MSTAGPSHLVPPSNPDYEKWSDVIRELIRHEDQLRNHRMDWFLRSEGFFFAALAFAWDKRDASHLVVLLAVLGIVFAWMSAGGLELSRKAKAQARDWWDTNVRPHYLGPDVVAYRTAEDVRSRSPWLRAWRYGFPLLFTVAWAGVLVARLALVTPVAP